MTKEPTPKKPPKPKKKGKRRRQAKPARARAKGGRDQAAAFLQRLVGARDKKGQFGPGNRFWKARSSSGPAPLFADGAALWAACEQYFEWVEDNPVYESHLVAFQGIASEWPVAKMRPMTIAGLCIFLDIAHRTWNEWKQDRPDLAEAQAKVESVIYTQKFTGAATGLLNANLISRDLGLADRQEHGGKDGGPIQFQQLEPKAPPKDVLEGWVESYRNGAEKHKATNGASQATGARKA